MLAPVTAQHSEPIKAPRDIYTGDMKSKDMRTGWAGGLGNFTVPSMETPQGLAGRVLHPEGLNHEGRSYFLGKHTQSVSLFHLLM